MKSYAHLSILLARIVGGWLVPIIVLVAAASPARAAPEGYFDLTTDVTFESGETWQADGRRYRLYGVQGCLRGTTYTDTTGTIRDCGDASLAMFAAYIKDTAPICAPIAQAQSVTYVMCYATVGGQRLDLGTVLITAGYAFAALDAEGVPYHMPYAVAEQQARDGRAGLWQFDDVQHPSLVLSIEANTRREDAQ